MTDVFLRKQPCTVTRVLDLVECPPDEIPHDPLDYPLYYDPVYFPTMHETVFQDPNSVCRWLSIAMEEHWTRCNSCGKPLGVTSCSVTYSLDCFTLPCAQRSVTIRADDIESSGFTFCRVSRKFHSESASHPIENFDINITLSNNPYWFYFKDVEYETNLNQLPVPILSRSMSSVTGRSFRLVRKSDLVRSILDDFLLKRAELISLTDIALKSRVAHR